MENWKDLYTELAEKIKTKIPTVQWVDLWSNQVNFLETEHPFQTPAVFLSFRTLSTKDMGERQQEVNLQVDFYLFFETFLDTFQGAYNQAGALEFLELMDALHGNFHGSAGENYSAMRRVGFNAEDTGGSGNLYRMTFSCLLQDLSAMKYYDETTEVDFQLNKGEEDEYMIL